MRVRPSAAPLEARAGVSPAALARPASAAVVPVRHRPERLLLLPLLTCVRTQHPFSTPFSSKSSDPLLELPRKVGCAWPASHVLGAVPGAPDDASASSSSALAAG